MNYKDVTAVVAYANNDMRLTSAALEAKVDYRTLSLRLDNVYRKTGLDPKRFRDLVKLVNAIEETQ